MKLAQACQKSALISRNIYGCSYIVPCANCESALVAELKTELTTHLKISRIHFKPCAKSVTEPSLLLRSYKPIQHVKRRRHYLSTMSLTTIETSTIQKMHTFVIIPLQVTISASHFFSVLCSNATIVSNRASKCSSGASLSF